MVVGDSRTIKLNKKAPSSSLRRVLECHPKKSKICLNPKETVASLCGARDDGALGEQQKNS